MSMETTFQKIIRRTGRKPIECKCSKCQSQCEAAPCLGTPEDIKKIIEAGYADKLMITDWHVGMVIGKMNRPIKMVQAEHTASGCIFFKEGLCELHACGLKPTEGKLSHHSTTMESYTSRKSLSYNVAKEWEDLDNAELIAWIFAQVK